MEELNPLHVPVFIVGCSRSGTTMLRLMLDSHPALSIPGESAFIRYLWINRRDYGTGDRFRSDRLLDDILTNAHFMRWGVSPQHVRNRVSRLLSPTFADIIAAPFEAYAEMNGKVRWGDKTPVYVLSISALAHLFPTARFVHLIRDGRDVASSHLSIPMLDGGIWEASLLWRDWVSSGIRSGRRLPSGHYIEIRYEDLVSDTDRQLRDLCSFLDLDFDRTMLSYHMDADKRLQTRPDWVEFHRNISQPPISSTRDWRREMPREDVRVFESVAGELLKTLGYERAFPKLSVGIRTRAQSRTAAHFVHIQGSRMKKSALRTARRAGFRRSSTP